MAGPLGEGLRPPGERGTRNVNAFLPYLAPALLVTVGLVQIHLALDAGLSPWKGGGFGMFSTVRSPASRMTRAYLVTIDRRIPILIPDPIWSRRPARRLESAQRRRRA